MRVSRFGAFLQLALIGSALTLVLPSPAGALSIVIPGQITDIDLSSAGQTLVYDGGTQTFTVDSDVDIIRTTGGDITGLASGQITFHMEVQLTTLITVTGNPVGNIIADFAATGTPAFTLTDNGADGNPLDDLLIAADLTSALTLNFQAVGAVNATALPTYQLLPGSALAGLISPTGTLQLQFTQLLDPNGVLLTTPCAILLPGTCIPPALFPAGMRDFSAQPTLDFTPDPVVVPEPSTLGLLGLGLLGAFGLRRRARR